MRNEYHHPAIDRVLGMKDITRLERTLFMPAIARCSVDRVDGAENPVYYKEGEEGTVSGGDDMNYHYSFSSTMDDVSGLRQYGVYEEASQQMRLDQLTLDECNLVRLHFHEKYVADGGHMEHLANDVMWQALYDPDSYAKISLSIASTKYFSFTKTEAIKSFSIERRLAIGNNAVILEEHHLDGNDAADSRTRGLTSDQVSALDLTGSDFCAVTVKDVDDIVDILEGLELIPQHGQKKFVRES